MLNQKRNEAPRSNICNGMYRTGNLSVISIGRGITLYMKVRIFLKSDGIVALYRDYLANQSIELTAANANVTPETAKGWIKDIRHRLGGGRVNRIKGRKQLQEAVRRIKDSANVAAYSPIPTAPEQIQMPVGCTHHEMPDFQWTIVTTQNAIGTSISTNIYAICSYCLLKKQL